MAISVFIVEDNPFTVQDLKEILRQEGMEVLKACYSAEQAKELWPALDPDVLLVDIKLKGKLTGIDFVHWIQEKKKVPVIYLSANSDKETVAKALDTKPESFLTKPFEDKDVVIAIELAFNKYNATQVDSNSHWFIRSGNRFIKLNISEILFLEADGSYSKIITDKDQYLVTGNLNVFAKQRQKNFIRIHRSYLVNIDRVSSWDGSQVFIDEYSIPIGRSYKSLFKGRIQQKNR